MTGDSRTEGKAVDAMREVDRILRDEKIEVGVSLGVRYRATGGNVEVSGEFVYAERAVEPTTFVSRGLL